MIWIHEQAQIGTTRRIKRFLWFPLRLKNQTRWLETVEIFQRRLSGHDGCGKWINESFL